MRAAPAILLLALACSGHAPPARTSTYPAKLAEGATVDGRRHGPWVFTDTWGSLRLDGEYRDGLRDGLWTLYKDGARVSDGRYRAGVADGRFRWYAADGAVIGEATLVAGNGLWQEWLPYPNEHGGVVADRGECLDDLRHGEWTLLAEGAVVHFDRGVAHGHWRFVEDWGVSEGEYVAGKRHGPWVEVASQYYEMPMADFEAQDLPHVPRTPEYMAEPVRIFRGEYRDGRRVGVWTVSTADGEPYDALPTLDHGEGIAIESYPPLRFSVAVDQYPEIIGRCPYPRDDASGKPDEIPY